VVTHRYLAVGAASFPDAIEQVGHQSKRLRRHLRSEQVATDMSGQANHQGDPKAPVQELPVNVGGASLAPGPSVMSNLLLATSAPRFTVRPSGPG